MKPKKRPLSTKFIPQSTLAPKQVVEQVKPVKAAKREKDPAMFDPSEYGNGKHPLQIGETRKGKQPQWVVEMYGKNN
jgi:hypothetical protein